MWKNVKDKSVVKNLKAITSFEELEKVLKYIQNMQSENIRTLVSEQFDMLPRLKSTNESGGQRIVKISGLNSDGLILFPSNEELFAKYLVTADMFATGNSSFDFAFLMLSNF